MQQTIKTIVERFSTHYESYTSSSYNETQLRREFLDPFFEALGWDVNNTQGIAEAYKDVIHEDAIKIGGFTKAPDYCFRIGGTRKFFVEAKKPAVDLKNDVSPAFQLRRYAWSAKLPISILSDFEEFVVFDTRIKPRKSDTASKGRMLYFKYTEYLDRWSEIESIFSRNAILKGNFDKFTEQARIKKGTEEVNDEFLKEIEKWREYLAKDLAKNNTSLTTRELNFSVQRIIDRIIFLRICEDRGIENYGQLMALQNGNTVYARLCELFDRADERYNSGLFHFREEKDITEAPDNLTQKLKVSDEILKDIFKHLYYPDSPYEFSVLPADILGQVYEQFLGKIIRLTSSHNAIVEEKPEVKKAGGVYYTPTYVVDYIVKQTVGKLLEGKNPAQVAKLKILDPACGSGSFLLGAYQYLLDWHRDWYVKQGPEKYVTGKNPVLYHARSVEWRLTSKEKKRILLNNIYGVDIDSQAVEVTKLSLSLKVLEGESEEAITQQLQFFRERALPDLGENIKCGNSLIGPDFYENQQMSFLDEEERYLINVFDWNTEFSEIMKNGGFDAVIGNPPYGYLIPKIEQQYFSEKYKNQDYQKDLYLLFLERYEYFLRDKGFLGIIVSNTWLQSITLRKIRAHLVKKYQWLRILHLPEKVFQAVVDTHVLIFKKGKKGEEKELFVDTRRNGKIEVSHILLSTSIPETGDPINVIASQQDMKIFRKIQNNSKPLTEYCDVFNGVKPFEKGKGNPPQTEAVMKTKPYVHIGPKPSGNWTPLLRGSLINRYVNLWDNNYWIQYGPWLAAPRDPAIFSSPLKIMVRQTSDSIIATLIEKDFIARNNLHILCPKNKKYDLRYLLGILNSKLMNFSYSLMNPEKGETLAEVKKQHVEMLPVHPIDFSNPSQKTIYDQVIRLVDEMISLHKQLKNAKTDQEKTTIRRQLEAADNNIDRLIYELYDLTEEEIRIIEKI